MSPPDVGTEDQDARAAASREGAARLVEVKVGAFVLLALLVAVAIVLLLAQKRHVFQRQETIHSIFQRVDGLREGAPVRLSGVNIGQVARISFSEGGSTSAILVSMEISHASLARIGADSVARIDSQGLLGDKIIELSVSEHPSAPVTPGATLASRTPADFNRLLDQASGVLASVRRVADGAAALASALGDPKTIADFQRAVGSIRKLGAAAESGSGLVHTLFYDPAQARAFGEVVTQVAELSKHANESLGHIERVLGATDKQGEQLVNNLSRAATNVADAAGDLHSSRIMPQLDKAAGDLVAITNHIRSGRGTVGMAIMDPTVYEQMLVVLGGINRSRVLRALVRYAITKNDEKKPPPIE